MNGSLAAAALIIAAVGLVHSVLGERYILVRLFRRDLPPLFGGDWFTKRTLRFAWHLTTLAWWALGWMLWRLAGAATLGRNEILATIAILSLVSGFVAGAFTRGRHLSWVAFFAVALLSWLAIE